MCKNGRLKWTNDLNNRFVFSHSRIECSWCLNQYFWGTWGTAKTHTPHVKHMSLIVTYNWILSTLQKEYTALSVWSIMSYNTDRHRVTLCKYTSQPVKYHLHVHEIQERECVCRLRGLHIMLSWECVCVCMLFDRTRDLEWLVRQREAVAPSCLCECVKRVPLQSCDSSMQCGKGRDQVHRERLKKKTCCANLVLSDMPLEWRTWPSES